MKKKLNEQDISYSYSQISQVINEAKNNLNKVNSLFVKSKSFISGISLSQCTEHLEKYNSELQNFTETIEKIDALSNKYYRIYEKFSSQSSNDEDDNFLGENLYDVWNKIDLRLDDIRNLHDIFEMLINICEQLNGLS